MKKITIILTILICVMLVGCNEKSSNAQSARKFAEIALTVPNKQIQQVESANLQAPDMVEYDKQMHMAITEFCDGMVSEEVISDVGSAFYNNIVLLHIMASKDDFTYTVENVKINRQNEEQFDYTATIVASNDADTLTLSGSIQFDSAGKINYMTVMQ